jgi:hypothetical protein
MKYELPHYPNGYGLELAKDSIEKFVKHVLEHRSLIIDSYIQAWLASNLPESKTIPVSSYSKWMIDNCELAEKRNGDEVVYFMRLKDDR